eukprot:1160446-Pelagomonas_calceolata.AAC.10
MYHRPLRRAWPHIRELELLEVVEVLQRGCVGPRILASVATPLPQQPATSSNSGGTEPISGTAPFVWLRSPTVLCS